MDRTEIIFRPRQKQFNFNGKNVDVPVFFQKNAKSYVYNTNNKSLNKFVTIVRLEFLL